MKNFENPLNPDDIVDGLNKRKNKNLIIAKCQYSPDPEKSERIIIFDVKTNSLKKVKNCWINPKLFTDLISKLNQFHGVSVGSCDAMFATKPHYVWCQKDSEFLIWEKGNPLVIAQKHEVKIISKGNTTTIKVNELTNVRCFLSSDWSLQGLRIVTRNGKEIEIAKLKEYSALIDPTYDHFNLIADTSWLTECGKSLASYLNIKLIMDKDLQ